MRGRVWQVPRVKVNCTAGNGWPPMTALVRAMAASEVDAI